jgi:hypothetical protein
VAYYNCGICYRVLENFEKSIENFQTALKMSEEENDLESYTLCLAQLAICFIFIGDIDSFIEHSNEFSEKNKSLGHIEMDLEIQILSGYVYNYKNDLDKAKDFYKSSLQNALLCENERYKHVSLCNIGIIEADKHIDDFWNNLGDPELSKNIDFDNYENNELLEEMQEQEEQKDIKQLENLENEKEEQNGTEEQNEHLPQQENEELDNGEQVNGNNEIGPEGEGEEPEVNNNQNDNEEYEENDADYPQAKKRGYSAGDNLGYSEPDKYNEKDQELEGEAEEQYMEGEGDPNEQQYMEGEGEPENEEGDEQYRGDADDIEGEQGDYENEN